MVYNNSQMKPVKGVLDLTRWEESNGRPSLSGEWEFYWNQLLNYDDFEHNKNNEFSIVQIPKTWNEYKENGKNLPGSGYATYRLLVKVEDTKVPLSMRIDNMSTAYNLFINDEKIASNGSVGVDANSSLPDYQPQTVSFIPPAKEFYIIVQVSNFTYARGGIWYEINLGRIKQIDSLNTFIIYKDAILLGSLLIMTLYYASFYFSLQKDKSSKYFMLLCIVFIIRTSLYGDFLVRKLFPQIPYNVIVFLTYVTLYWITILIFLMINNIFGKNKFFWINRIFVIYGIIMTLMTAVLPVSIYTSFIALIEIIGISMMLISVSIIIRAYLENIKWAGLILVAVGFILITGIHDVLYQANIIYSAYGEYASIGIFFLMFAFSFVIAGQLSDAYEQSKILSKQLSESLTKEKTAAVELSSTQMAFLKAQIKPHFIYNSLSVIAALTIEEPQKAKELLYNLTDYLRGSFQFDNQNGLTSFDKEMDTVKAYLAIEKARFQDKLVVKYELDNTIGGLIPLLCIQPIVENAVRHGIRKKNQQGTVVIRTYKKDNTIIIEVEDDGVGIETADLEEILAEKTSIKGVGIKNINKRLELLYGTNLEIISDIENGTLVRIRIPDEGSANESDYC